MRTAVIGEFYPESFAINVANGLAQLGHEVERISMDLPSWAQRLRLGDVWARLRLLPSGRNPLVSLVQRGFREQIRKLGRRDLIVVTHDYLSPDDVDFVRATSGAKLAFWFPDHIGAWGRALFLNASYDAVFLKDPYAVHELRAFTRLPIHYLPECFDPRAYAGFRSTDIPARFHVDVTTAGNCYSYRVAALSGLTRFQSRIWGNPAPSWMRTDALNPILMNEYVANVTKAHAFRGAKIVVNSLNPAEVWGVNARAFEVSGCGAFQLITWRPALSQLFVDGEELVSYRSASDLDTKIEEYLTRPLRRARIARAGLVRATQDHTYERRLELMTRTVLGDAEGFPVVPPTRVVQE